MHTHEQWKNDLLEHERRWERPGMRPTWQGFIQSFGVTILAGGVIMALLIWAVTR